MGKSLNYFKTYKIEDDEIKYIGGGSWGYTSNSISNLQYIISVSNVQIPEYDWQEPPKELELVNPTELIKAFIKGLELLEKEKNPIVDGEPFFSEYEIIELDKYRNNLIIILNDLLNLSQEGFFLTVNAN